MQNNKIVVKKSIQKDVVIKISILLTLAMFILSFVSILFIKENIIKQTNELLENKAYYIQDRLEQRMSYLIENTILLTKNEFLVNSFIDIQSRQKYLKPLVANFMEGKDVVSVNIVDFDGKAIFKTQNDIPTFKSSEELRTSLAFSTLTTYIQKSDNNIVVIVPVEYYSTTQGALVVVFNLEEITNRNIPNDKNIYIKLLKNNIAIYNHNFKKNEQYESLTLRPDITNIYLVKLNILLNLGLEKSVYLAPVKDAVIKLSLITFILIIIGILFSIVFANGITSPIVTLYNRVTSSMDNKDIKCAPLGTDDELESLARAFDERTLMLQYQAEHDSLTQLPNRVLFLDRLEQAIRAANRENTTLAILFLDLDRFKEINDSFGHNVGDKLLISVGKKFENTIRQSDSVARMGGDEFTIIINKIKDDDVVIDIVDKIMYSLKEAIVIDENKFFINCSIGVAIYPQNGTTPQELLKNADTAMYKAKQDGRNSYQFYTDDMTQKAYERLNLHTNLRQALENNELEVYYQLQTDMRTNEIIGMESLVRWNNKQLGSVSPDTFIPIAEETGLIIEIDRFVTKEAIMQFTHWCSHRLCTKCILSINLSIIQLSREDFIDFITETIQVSNINPNQLMFEITETQIMKDPELSIVMLNKLKKLGVKLAIDDFGTGHSSLSYLKRLPIDKIKIDQSFIRDVTEDKNDEELVRAIIALAKSLKMDIIAEGVETKEQIDFLVENGCYEAQGFFYFKPQQAYIVTKKLNT